MKKPSILFFLALLPLMASAYDAKIDGIYYNFDSSTKQATVTYDENVDIIIGSYTGGVNIPENVTYNGVIYSVTSIGDDAFSYCSGLTSLTIPSSVTSIGLNAFFGCTNIEKIELNSNTIVSKSYDLTSSSLKYVFGEQVKEYVIGDEVTSIGESAFNGCSGLNSITIGNSVKSINDYAFYGCSALNSITIGNSVTSIGRQVFYECSNIASITVGKENTKYDSRDNCNAIIETASNQLIFGCRNTIIPQTVTSIENGAFEGCSGLKSLTIPNSVRSIEYLAFSGCSGLTSIEFPNSVTYLGDGAFSGCYSLTSITIPESVTSIASGVFSGCSGLTSIELSSKVTYIGDYAFSGCLGLTSIELPSSVKQIGDCSFKNCSGLTDIYCFAESVPTTATNAFDTGITNATLYIPRVSAETYKATLPWSEFGNFVLLSDGEVKINETNFPDENFRSYLLKQSYGSDSILTNAEIASVTSIQLDSYYSSAAKIKSLQGIEYFTELNSLDCYGNQLTSLDLSKNTKLTSLRCSSNQLTSIDLSKNTALTYLYCPYNQLTSLDLSKNTVLTSLSCYNNQLTSLELSKNTALTSLSCYNNQLTSLDVSGCTALTSLDCYSNQIKGEAMDALIASLPTITSGSSYDGRMEVINNSSERNMMTIDQVAAAKAKGWTPLYKAGSGYSDWQEYAGLDPTKIIEINETTFPDECFRNWLLSQSYGEDGMLTDTEILTTTTMYVYSYYGSSIQSLKGIEHFTELTSLSCTNHSLTTIDLSKNTKLTNLECYSNQITGEGMDALIASLPEVSNGELKIIYNYNEGNEMSTKQAAAAKVKGWIPQAYVSDGSYYYEWKEYAGMDVDPSLLEKFPDAAFRKYLLSQSYGLDGEITDEEIATVTRIDVPYKKIKSLKGIEYFIALEMLDCGSNQLADLDLSKNRSLTFLNCYNNQLTSLDLSNNTLLSDLDCSNNQLKTLNLSGCKKLVEVGVGNNQLTTLDLSGCAELEEFGCHDNQLTSLNLSGCISLDRLTCYNNQLKGASMDAFIATLPTVPIGEMRVLSVEELYKTLGYNVDLEGGNEMTLEQIIAAKAKGWIPYAQSNNYSSSKWIEYLPNDPSGVGLAINEINFPDENFRTYLLGTSYGSDGVLTELEASLVNTMDVHKKGIQSLKGIEFFKELKELDCEDNQIETLDLSKNPKITYLECGENGITSLDVSACEQMISIVCGDNQLTSLNVSNCTKLEDLECSDNLLTSLNVSNCTKLEELECSDNLLTSLNVSNCTKLEELECNDNQLTSLDLSNNPVLRNLDIYKNKIKGTAMDNLIASLPIVNEISLKVIYNEGEGNEMTKSQAAAAMKRGWIPQRYGLVETDYGSYYSWDDYYGSDYDTLRGDANGDGKVDMDDATFVTNIILGTEVATEAADVNKDGKIGMPDVMFIIHYIKNGKFPDE